MNMKLQSVLHSFVLFCCAAIIAVAQQPAADKVEPSKTGSIKGRVLGEDGQPLSNIPVMAIPFGRNAARRPGQPQAPQPAASPAQTITDDEGNFEFVNLAPASYAISASAPGYVAPTPEDAEDEEENRSGLYRLGDVANISLVKGGVITGKVFNASNEPLTGVSVSVIRIGNVNGEPDELSAVRGQGRSWRTDDRGVYRVYGLIPGTYIVQAGQIGRPGGGQGNQLSPYSQDAPTYYPSSARDAAIPLAVQVGAEIAGIDIRYRADKGRSVGGKVIVAQAKATTQTPTRPGRANDFGSTEIRLSVAGTDSVVATTIQPDGQASGFAFYSIPDGEYEIYARRSGAAGESDSVSESRRVSVQGADV
ncbi:MAG: carboxypeptidase-like regulatory domain-containing protein, partial [Acidobacteriota bacterium]